METKGITCKIPQELHAKITEEIRASGSTMSKFIEMVINGYYDSKEKGETNMGKMRTMAFQVSEELFQKIKIFCNLIRLKSAFCAKEVLNKSPRASRRHIFRLSKPQNLEIH